MLGETGQRANSTVTKGALTNGAVAAQANGFFGAYLKFSGYDGIILQGGAKRWVYLYIDSGRAELRDASHLVGRRIVNLLRVFNIRHGHTAEMDAPSPRYGSIPVDGPSQGKSIMVYWNELRSQYYEQMGWNRETGKPLPDTLRHFGLEHTIPELWGR